MSATAAIPRASILARSALLKPFQTIPIASSSLGRYEWTAASAG
ncbi:hypothetical protein [Stenotrophomonas maltophilia]